MTVCIIIRKVINAWFTHNLQSSCASLTPSDVQTVEIHRIRAASSRQLPSKGVFAVFTVSLYQSGIMRYWIWIVDVADGVFDPWPFRDVAKTAQCAQQEMETSKSAHYIVQTTLVFAVALRHSGLSNYDTSYMWKLISCTDDPRWWDMPVKWRNKCSLITTRFI